jgi:hypothetical protein
VGIEKEHVIDQVLVFKDEEKSAQLGPALWAALEEVSRYFTPNSPDGWLELPLPSTSQGTARVRPVFRRRYVAPVAPAELEDALGGDYQPLDEKDTMLLWSEAERRNNVYDPVTLGVAISNRFGLESSIVVVDQEIQPPSNWRYVIWSGYPGGAVISFVPIDPQYWGSSSSQDGPDQDRLNEIKRGVRASAMSVAGSFVGLSRCDNPRCFMFAAVDSVTRLDEMLSLGPEHSVLGLARGAFPPRQEDPNEVATPLTSTEGPS